MRGIAWITYRLAKALAPGFVGRRDRGCANFSVQIRNNCNPIYEMGRFAAAGVAYPTSAKQCVSRILLAGAALYVVNLVRVMSLL